MIFKVPLLVALTLASTSLAGWVKFCNEKDLKGSCNTELIGPGAGCRLVPDSNAKGDKGSSVDCDLSDDLVDCELFPNNDCTWSLDDPDNQPVHFKKKTNLKQKWVARSYRCNDKTMSSDQDEIVAFERRSLSTVLFCEEKDLKGDCQQVTVEPDECHKIPDSNAKGDKGSSAASIVGPGMDYCPLFASESCTFEYGVDVHYPINLHGTMNMEQDWILRSFLCKSSDKRSAEKRDLDKRDELSDLLFCNDHDLQGHCEAAKAAAGTCYKVPDSNVKGDTGSSVNVALGAGFHYCSLYASEDCSFQFGRKNEKFPVNAHLGITNLDQDWVLRSYSCKRSAPDELAA